MTITDIKTTKRGGISVYADGEYLLTVPPEVYIASSLQPGMEIDAEALTKLCTEAAQKKARERALTLLSYKEYTAGELERRLRRDVDEESASLAVERMEELGLIDDDDYAERFARDLSERRHFGILRVKQEMRRKGLSAEQIEFACSLLTRDPIEEIRKIVKKKYPLAGEDEKVRRRAFAAMMRMGYTSADVRHALELSDGWDAGMDD